MKKLTVILLSISFLTACGYKSRKDFTHAESGIIQEDEILFQVETKNPDDLEIFEDGVIPWISIKDPEAEIENLIGKNKIVLKCDSAILIIDYPLNNPDRIVIKPQSNSGFTRKELIRLISKEYHRIYKEEEETAQIKTQPLEERDIHNRNQTDGKYGIWGHDIDDLDLSSIIIHRPENGVIELELYVES